MSESTLAATPPMTTATTTTPASIMRKRRFEETAEGDPDVDRVADDDDDGDDDADADHRHAANGNGNGNVDADTRTQRMQSPFAGSNPIASSRPTTSATSATSAPRAIDPVAASASHEINPEMLRLYYDRLFPVSLFFSWLSPAVPDKIRLREFSFTLKDDIYIRYCAFATKEEFKDALVARLPYKIDIGAVYNASPAMHTSISHFVPVEKEFVIDVDMTDYDDVRRCCSAANICHSCWILMTAAVKVVDRALREDFGFRHLLWVYSGRRGVHLWVCDPRARTLNNDVRSAIIDYLSLSFHKNGEGGGAAGAAGAAGAGAGAAGAAAGAGASANGSTVGPKQRVVQQYLTHPSLVRAYDTLLPYFAQLVEAQQLLDTDASRMAFLSFFDEKVQEHFKWTEREVGLGGGGGQNSLRVWEALERKVRKYLAAASHQNRTPQTQSVRSALQRIVFSHIFPRLDVNVSKQLNHLLKSPFCVHPKTGRVCVPFDPQLADQFDPLTVPTLDSIEAELNQSTAAATIEKHKSYLFTSLKPYIEHFQRFVRELQRDSRGNSAASNGDTEW